jgi:hypothetical protein
MDKPNSVAADFDDLLHWKRHLHFQRIHIALNTMKRLLAKKSDHIRDSEISGMEDEIHIPQVTVVNEFEFSPNPAQMRIRQDPNPHDPRDGRPLLSFIMLEV